MLVGNLAKYDTLIGMPFLKQQGAIIECGGSAIDFPSLELGSTARLAVDISEQRSSPQKM